MTDSRLIFNTKRLKFKSWMPNSRYFFIGHPDGICVFRNASLPHGFTYSLLSIKGCDFKWSVTLHYHPYEHGALRVVSQEELEAGFEIGIGKECDFFSRFKIKLDFEQEEPKKPSLLECGLCTFEYDEVTRTPKFLPCGHTFCESCLQTLQQNVPKTPTGPLYFQCPTDRTFIVAEPQSLPKNRIVIDMIREKKADGPILVRDPYVPCVENKWHESAVYCEGCNLAYCQFCFNSTHSAKVLSDHTSVPIAHMPTVYPKCSIHEKENAHVFCKKPECNNTFCHACFTSAHQDHPNELVHCKIAKNLEGLTAALQEIESAKTELNSKIEKLSKDAERYDLKDFNLEAQVDEHLIRQKENVYRKFKDFLITQKNIVYTKHLNLRTSEMMLAENQREIEKTLKRKTNLYDVKELMVENKRICMPREDNDETPALLEAFVYSEKLSFTLPLNQVSPDA